MKKLLIAFAVCAFIALVFIVNILRKPDVVAKVELGATVVVITNGNDKAWEDTTIMLNDAFSGPRLKISGPWKSGERRKLQLAEFKGTFNKQPFKPDFERVNEVTVDVDGYLLNSYKMH